MVGLASVSIEVERGNHRRFGHDMADRTTAKLHNLVLVIDQLQ
jgi:hypothetical protein